MRNTITASVMFTDVVASSKLRRGQGEMAAQSVLDIQRRLLRRQVQTFSGREVKTLGDGLMMAFTSARDAVNCAVAIQRAIAEHNRQGRKRLPEVRVGINIGEVIEEEGDLFGLPVDAAEHIQSKAKAGQILVSELVRGVVGVAEDLQFTECGRVRLKNFPGRWRLYEVPWQAGAPSQEVLMCALIVCDLIGLVPTFERIGDERGTGLLRAYYAIIRAELAPRAVLWSKTSGDNFLAALKSPRSALACAIDMQRAFAVYNQEHPEEPLRARIALHAGEVIREADDLFGRALHFTIRLSAMAQDGQILASSQIKEFWEPDQNMRFRERRAVELRGFAGKHRVYTVLAR